MKRHPSLHPLSQHHHYALMESLYIRRALEKDEPERETTLKAIAKGFLAFWEEKGKIHFREEEEILVPAYAIHVSVETDADVVRMLADHAAIRGRIRRLEDRLATGEPIAAELTELGSVLQAHVRLEEDVIFPRMERTLSGAEMERLGKSLTRLHTRGECDTRSF